MPQLTRRYNQGAVDSRGRDSLKPGEMQEATGVVYKPGDPHRAHKIDGRSTFGDTSTAVSVDGLELLKYDPPTVQIQLPYRRVDLTGMGDISCLDADVADLHTSVEIGGHTAHDVLVDTQCPGELLAHNVAQRLKSNLGELHSSN